MISLTLTLFLGSLLQQSYAWIDPKHGINHDSIAVINAPAVDGSWIPAWQPRLAIVEGCHPYPAVDSTGEFSWGLRPSGPLDGECSAPKDGGQVYTRSRTIGKKLGVMYAYYFPKFQDPVTKLGHFHSWHHVIVWSDSSGSYPSHVSTEFKGRYTSTTLPAILLGRPIIQKFEYGMKYQGFGQAKQAETLANWEDMPVEARDRLNTYHWMTGEESYDIHCPVNDGNFNINMDFAYNTLRL